MSHSFELMSLFFVLAVLYQLRFHQHLSCIDTISQNMGGITSKQKPNYVVTEEYDPCKSFGCALQSCFYDQINKKRNGSLVDEDPCLGARIRLEQCRRSHFLNRQSNMNRYFDENNVLLDEYKSFAEDDTLTSKETKGN